MKILFIYPAISSSYPLQIGALSAYLKEKGHEVKLVIFEDQGSTDIPPKIFDRLNQNILAFKPDFVAFSCYEMSFPIVEAVSRFIKINYPQIIILVGGYYPTLAPEEVINSPAVDIICRGEGERPLAGLFASTQTGKEETKIKNLWFKKGNQIIKNPIGPLIEDLDSLPFPDRDLLNYQEQLDFETVGERTVNVMATRGCPFQCTYCCNNYFKLIYPNKERYLRFRSPENVIRELKQLKNKYHFEKVGFHDDNLTLNIEWLKSFSILYKKEVDLPFYCAARVESCSEEVLYQLKQAGCYLLLLGIESGDENYRTEMMKRQMSNITIIDAFRRSREKKIQTWSFTMVGLPLENRRMLLRTLLLNWHCQPDFVMASIFYPLKGTELGDLCYKNNWVNIDKKAKISYYDRESIQKHPVLSP